MNNNLHPQLHDDIIYEDMLQTKLYCRRLITEAEKQRRVSNNQPEPEPQVEPEHEPSPRPEYEPEPKPNDEPDTEPEDEHDPDTDPEPEPARKRKRKQHHSPTLQRTLKRAPKTTPKRNVQIRHVNVEEPVSEHTDLTLITTRSWSGLLRHRMAPGGFQRLVERL